MPRPIGTEDAPSLSLIEPFDEIALATLEAAIEAAGVEMPVPFALAAAEGSVEDVERTVMRGVDVTPVFSADRRKLGMDRAG